VNYGVFMLSECFDDGSDAVEAVAEASEVLHAFLSWSLME
jgi:hypothetical protein